MAPNTKKIKIKSPICIILSYIDPNITGRRRYHRKEISLYLISIHSDITIYL